MSINVTHLEPGSLVLRQNHSHLCPHSVRVLMSLLISKASKLVAKTAQIHNAVVIRLSNLSVDSVKFLVAVWQHDQLEQILC